MEQQTNQPQPMSDNQPGLNFSPLPPEPLNPQPQTMSEVPVVPPTKSKSKGGLVIGALVIFVTGVVLALNYLQSNSPKPISTANQTVASATPVVQEKTQPASIPPEWKTFADTKNGFSFRYPNTWTVKGNVITESKTCPSPKTFETKDCEVGTITVTGRTKLKTETLSDAVDKLRIEQSLDEPQIYEDKDKPQNLIALNAIEANYMGMYGPIAAYIPLSETKYVEISGFATDSDTVQTIFSSFSFDNKGSGWKTYRDANNRFTFEYPTDWIINGNRFEEKLGTTHALAQKGIEVEVHPDAGKLTALQYLETIFYKDYTGEVEGLKNTYLDDYRNNEKTYFKEVSVDGMSATLITELTTPPGSIGSGVWISLGKDGLLLRSYSSTDYQDQQKIFDGILDSFKFLK